MKNCENDCYRTNMTNLSTKDNLPLSNIKLFIKISEFKITKPSQIWEIPRCISDLGDKNVSID